MKHLRGMLLPAVVVLMAACNLSPKKGTTYIFKEVGWTVTIPPQFHVMDEAATRKMNEKGTAMMEKSAGTKLDISSTRTLITARKGVGSSYFGATITPFDANKDGAYPSDNRAAKDLVYKTFSDQMPDAILDTASEPARVGGLRFDRFRLSVTIKGHTVFTMFMLARLYKGYDFGLNYLYTDLETQIQVERILASCKFQ